MSDRAIVELGEISGTFGVKGWVKIFSFTNPRENILNYSPWCLSRNSDAFVVRVADGHRQGKGVVAALDGIDSQDEAARLCGMRISVDRSRLPSLEQGEYYWTDLVGLDVFTRTGIALGKVDNIIETGANDVLVVKGDRERLIPFIQRQVIEKIDLSTGTIVVDWDPEF